MIAFLSIGSHIEKNIGFWKFWFYFLFFGICAGFTDSLYNEENTFLLGSSGSIWGLLILIVFMYPDEELKFFWSWFSLKLKWVIGFALLFEIYSVFEIENDGVSHLAHIGGALSGALVYLFENLNNKFRKWKLF